MGLKWFALLALLVAGCTQPRTQMLLVVDTDLSVPDALDEVRIEVESPLFERQFANAMLRDTPPPRSLNLAHEGGPLGTFEVRVRGFQNSAPVVEQTVEFMFVPDETRVLRVMLLASCMNVTCAEGETCDAGGCRPQLRAEDELEEFDRELPLGDAGAPSEDSGAAAEDGGPELDAGRASDAGACVPGDEVCNGSDDDCDESVDEDFDLTSDPSNCGMCGRSCGDAPCVGGLCQIECTSGTASCDDDPSDCEVDTNSDAANCGGCGEACEAPRDMCCDGRCRRRCG
ncbi:MAG: hypothetical protein AB8I08_06900 [Sandaracinaceae bacterium]